MPGHYHPALYVDIYNCVFFRCLATIWPWYHTGGQEQERSQDVQMNFNLCSWEWFEVCWQWLDPSHKGSWRLICKLLHQLKSTMLSRTKINANWQHFGVIKDALILLALLGKSFTWYALNLNQCIGRKGWWRQKWQGAGVESHHVRAYHLIEWQKVCEAI